MEKPTREFEFYVNSNADVNEVRFTPDILFVSNRMLGVSAVIVENCLKNEIAVGEFLRKLADVADYADTLKKESEDVKVVEQ